MFDFEVEQINLSKIDRMVSEFPSVKGKPLTKADVNKTISTTSLQDLFTLESGLAFTLE